MLMEERYKKLHVELEEQKEVLRVLKLQKKTKEELQPHIDRLLELKREFTSVAEEISSKRKESEKEEPDHHKDILVARRSQFEDCMRRRYFLSQAFEIYGGVAGLYDFGPPGTALKNSVISLWRQHFVFEDNLLELETTCLTPECVLKASGHVDRFTDFMVREEVTNECYRADKLLEEFIDRTVKGLDPILDAEKIEELEGVKRMADEYSQEQLDVVLKKYEVKTEAGNAVSSPFPFNLMFSTSIGPVGNLKGFLRPETAQGIFVNFKRLLDYNGSRLPFGAATIGQAFRNEIAPRAALIRVREFTLCEVEYFVHPNKRSPFPKFHMVAPLKARLLSRDIQAAGESKPLEATLEEAVSSGLIANETLAYFMGRTLQFLDICGVPSHAYRFRQHRANEMAHYANDCWDAELLTSYGWVECVGIADRSCFDLTSHSKSAKVELTAYEVFEEPRTVNVIETELNMKLLGKTFRKQSKDVVDYLKFCSDCDKEEISGKLEKDGKCSIDLPSGATVEITSEMVKFAHVEKKIHGETFIPSVIEPSFGVGRIIYAILEHAYWVREGDEQRSVLSLSPAIAPYKCGLVPLSNNPEFNPVVEIVRQELTKRGVSCKVDDSSVPIGRKYARSDEIGIPYIVTVDFQSIKDETVTLRERDGCAQIRCPVSEIGDVVAGLVAICSSETARKLWEETQKKYPVQEQTASELVGKFQ